MLQQMAPQYRQASASEKRMLLESFITTTGYVRKYARWLLNHAQEVQQMLHRPRPQYGSQVQQALRFAFSRSEGYNADECESS